MGTRSSIAATITAIALIGAACSPTAAPETTSSTAPATLTTVTVTTTEPSTTTTTIAATTTLPPTTTTTEPPLVVSDAINGLPVDDPALIDRRLVAIKIDNHQRARPQSGLMESDVVYEILVEAGYTRFIAMFHQSDLDWVGPVRSGRPTDISVIKPLDAPFQISGAQKYVIQMFRDADLRMVYDNGTTTWRERDRRAPHNLYSSSLLLRDWADAKSWPDENPGNMFAFGESELPTQRANRIVFDWSNQPNVIWKWTGSEYERFNGDEPHGWIDQAGNEGTVSSPMLLAIIGDRYTVRPPPTTTTTTTTTTTIEGTEPTPPPPAPKAPTSVPAVDIVGTGEMVLFHEGRVLRGTWSKESKSAGFELFREDGTPLILPPSRMWVSIFPSNREIRWR